MLQQISAFPTPGCRAEFDRNGGMGTRISFVIVEKLNEMGTRMRTRRPLALLTDKGNEVGGVLDQSQPGECSSRMRQLWKPRLQQHTWELR